MRRADLIAGVVFLAFSAFYYFFFIPTQIVFSVPPERAIAATLHPDFLPRLSALLFASLSALLVLGALRKGESEVGEGTSARSFFQVGVVLAVGLAYVYAMELVGFLISSPIFLAALITFLGTRDWRYVVPAALLLPPLVSYFFWFFFGVVLPEGRLF